MIMLFDQDYAVQQTIKAQREEGWKEGLKEGPMIALSNLVRDGLLSVDIAAREANMKEEDFQTLMNQQQAEEAKQGSGT